uniref:Uncharacterized protein n=1 Tax=Arundo donax TaxID=35708 RepID=A0A0A8XT14_ARUDO
MYTNKHTYYWPPISAGLAGRARNGRDS